MLARKYFLSSTKKWKIDNDDEISDSHVSGKDYLMGKKNWDKFDIKIIGDYHDHYLKKDLLLLANVFEKFIDICLNFYGVGYLSLF